MLSLPFRCSRRAGGKTRRRGATNTAYYQYSTYIGTYINIVIIIVISRAELGRVVMVGIPNVRARP